VTLGRDVKPTFWDISDCSGKAHICATVRGSPDDADSDSCVSVCAWFM